MTLIALTIYACEFILPLPYIEMKHLDTIRQFGDLLGEELPALWVPAPVAYVVWIVSPIVMTASLVLYCRLRARVQLKTKKLDNQYPRHMFIFLF